METEDIDFFQVVITDIYEEFITTVAEEREMELDEVKELADGRVYTGRQAAKLGLIDEVGSMEDAVDWLAEELDFAGSPELVYPEKDAEGVLEELVGATFRGLYGEAIASSAPTIEYRYIGP